MVYKARKQINGVHAMADERNEGHQEFTHGGEAGVQRSEERPAAPLAPIRPFGAGSFPPPPPGAYAAAGISAAMMAPKPRSRQWLWWVLGSVVLVLALLTVGGLKVWHVFQSAAREEIVPLHEAMKRGDLAGILAAADPAYRQEVGQERSDKLFTLIHDKMGDPVSYTVLNVNKSAYSGQGVKMTLVLDTTFTKGNGQETLVFHKDDGTWKMLGYHCRSSLLKGHSEK
jgi:hypothetical protein